MSNDEEWKFVNDSNNKYQVSNLGRIKSFQKNPNGEIMKCNLHRSGYLRVCCRINNIIYRHSIHRLVAIHFIPNPNNLPLVDHIDGDITNNKVENLRWVTHQQNALNSKIQRNNTSGYKGVYFHTTNKRWVATCMIDGKLKLKSFKELTDAITCRKEWVEEHYPKEFQSWNDSKVIVENDKTEQNLIDDTNFENEKWVYVNDSDNMYQISTMGRIKSFRKYKDGKILQTHTNTCGYIDTKIIINNKQISQLLHRLLAEHFVPNPNNYILVDHIDGDRTNNKIENLRWVSPSQNGMNTKLNSNNNSGYKGVCKEKNSWVASCIVKGKTIKKRFLSLDDAVKYRKYLTDTYYSHHYTDGR